VEAPGHFIGFFIKLAARMQPGHHKFKRADFLYRVDINRNAAAVILHPDYIVSFQNYKNFAAEALHGLIDRVIDYLKNQMMQAVYTRSPDIHAGAFADSFQAFENRNILCRIAGIRLLHYLYYKNNKKK
jgi:hypothetical protein